jgi:hypothetical protein
LEKGKRSLTGGSLRGPEVPAEPQAFVATNLAQNICSIKPKKGISFPSRENCAEPFLHQPGGGDSVVSAQGEV